MTATNTNTKFDVVGAIMAYEGGDMDQDQTIEHAALADDIEGQLCECGRAERSCAVYVGASEHRDRS